MGLAATGLDALNTNARIALELFSDFSDDFSARTLEAECHRRAVSHGIAIGSLDVAGCEPFCAGTRFFRSAPDSRLHAVATKMARGGPMPHRRAAMARERRRSRGRFCVLTPTDRRPAAQAVRWRIDALDLRPVARLPDHGCRLRVDEAAICTGPHTGCLLARALAAGIH